MIPWASLVPAFVFVLYWAAIIGVALRVISKRRTQGVSLAWLAVLAWVPILGVVLYVLFGESWLSNRRAKRMTSLERAAMARFETLHGFAAAEDDPEHPFLSQLNRLARSSSEVPTLAGNAVDLLDDADEFFPALLEAINAAERTVSLLFYIYSPGGRVDLVTQALIAAAGRGVKVRLLVDAVGSRPFLESPWRRDLVEAGVEVRVAMPVRFAWAWVARVDLRNHRKLAVFDGETAMTGSMNIADPAVFKRHAGVGPWVDIMARVRGPAAHALDLLFAIDWSAEHADESIRGEHPCEPRVAGDVPVHIVASGPGADPDELRRVLLQSIYAAREELVVSTPYFVPDDTMMTALTTAAKRGVATTLIVPERVDSVLVRHASRSYYDDLLRAGVRVLLFQGGLLHSKTAVIDRRLVLLGSANMDRRSLWINFELSVFLHDEQLADQMRYIQQRYITRSRDLATEGWRRRSLPSRLVDNAAQLLAPIL